MHESLRLPRSFSTIAMVASSVRQERGTAMDEGMYRVVWDEHERRVAWVNEHAWKYEEMWARRRSYRTIIAAVFRAVAARIAPATEQAATSAEAAMQR